MHIVSLASHARMSTRNDYSFRAIVDVTQGKQIISTEMQLILANRQPNAVGKMSASRAINYARTQNHQLETITLLVFPEQLFLTQFGVGIMIAPLGVGFEHRLFVHACFPAEASHSVHTE